MSRGPALAAGLQAGDVVLGVNGAGVSTVAELKREVARAGHTVALLIQREDAQIYIPVDLGLMQTAAPLFSGSRCTTPPASRSAPFLPTSRAEMAALGWQQCDVIIVTGDAYVDHPSFGMAIIGRVLEAQGFKVGIIAQPDWHGTRGFHGASVRRGCSSA